MPSKDKSSQLPWPTKLASTAHLKCIKNRATPQHLPSNPNQEEAFFITTFKSQTAGLSLEFMAGKLNLRLSVVDVAMRLANRLRVDHRTGSGKTHTMIEILSDAFEWCCHTRYSFNLAWRWRS
jgi:hypothetical protein